MSHKCFTNNDCPYFPCHAETEGTTFNCMFCYCPLYALGPDCGGDYAYTSNGVKDCSNCTLPHQGEAGWDHVIKNIGRLIEKARVPQQTYTNKNKLC